MPIMNGNTILLEMLKAEGVKYIFGNPGTSESAIMDALEQYPEIEYILSTQEGVSMGMADGFARSTKTPTFVNLHIDSGLANGISLLNNAYAGGTPLILTAANKDIRKLVEGRTNLVDMVKPFTKWAAEITEAEQIPSAIRRAFNEAKTPPTGPVFLAFSADALDKKANVNIIPSRKDYHPPEPNINAINKTVEIINSCTSPTILVGDRMAQSTNTNSLENLAELIGAKVYSTSYSEMNFPTTHPQYCGPLTPNPSTKKELSKSDLIIGVGTNLFSSFFYFSGEFTSSTSKLIHIDSAFNEIGKSEPTDIGILADPEIAVEQICTIIKEKQSGDNTERIIEQNIKIKKETEILQQKWNEQVNKKWNNLPMPPERMMVEISKSMPENSIIIDDSISSRSAMHGAIKFNKAGSIFGERGGAIGWGMGGALGVKLANPDKPVMAIIGDGSSMMTVQALWTAANYSIPVIYLICNNESYRILKLNMNVYKTQILKEKKPESKYIGADFPIPLNISKIAEAIGVYGKKITDPKDISLEISKALKLNKPAVLDISIDNTV